MKKILLFLTTTFWAPANWAQPNAGAPVVITPPSIQVSTVASGSTGKLFLKAQLVQNTRQVAPFTQLPLALSSWTLTKAAGSPAYTEICSLTTAGTILECTLAPSPGPGWSNPDPVAVRVRLQSTSGDVGTTLVTFTGGTNTLITTTVQNGAGSSPATSNSTPVRLVGQLLRPLANQSPIDQTALALAGGTITPASVSVPFSASCGLTNSSTMFECTLSPTGGGNWTVAGPAIFSLHLAGADGVGSTQLLTFRVNF